MSFNVGQGRYRRCAATPQDGVVAWFSAMSVSVDGQVKYPIHRQWMYLPQQQSDSQILEFVVISLKNHPCIIDVRPNNCHLKRDLLHKTPPFNDKIPGCSCPYVSGRGPREKRRDSLAMPCDPPLRFPGVYTIFQYCSEENGQPTCIRIGKIPALTPVKPACILGNANSLLVSLLV